MAENWIFGPNINLPSVPGLPSTCEVELLQLMKEIDLAVGKKSKKWEEEIKETNMQCISQKQEIEQLKNAFRAKDSECCSLQQRYDADHLKYMQQEDLLLKQIEDLKEENARLQKNGMLLQKEKENETEREDFQNEKFWEIRNHLMVEIKTLKDQIQVKDQTQALLEDSYQKLLSFIMSSQSGEKEKSTNKKKMDDLGTNIMKEIVANFSENFAKEEELYQNNLRSTISQDILTLQEQLKATLK